MERHLAGVENAVDRAAAVNLHSNLLPAREEVVLVERIDVLEVILRLRARQELHAPALEVGGRKRHPGRHYIVLAEAPIEGVLMPRYEPGAVRLLDEEIRRPTEQVRSQHIFGCIDDPGGIGELADPGAEQR